MTTPHPDKPDALTLEKALRRAFSMGQTYWAQSDSESYSANREASETHKAFEDLVASTVAAVATQEWGQMVETSLSGAEIGTLVALVERGPLWDGDVPSKSGRDSLINRGLAVRVVVKGEDGWQAATYSGRDAYKALFPLADTMNEARANRIAARAIGNAKSQP